MVFICLKHLTINNPWVVLNPPSPQYDRCISAGTDATKTFNETTKQRLQHFYYNNTQHYIYTYFPQKRFNLISRGLSSRRCVLPPPSAILTMLALRESARAAAVDTAFVFHRPAMRVTFRKKHDDTRAYIIVRIILKAPLTTPQYYPNPSKSAGISREIRASSRNIPDNTCPRVPRLHPSISRQPSMEIL